MHLQKVAYTPCMLIAIVCFVVCYDLSYFAYPLLLLRLVTCATFSVWKVKSFSFHSTLIKWAQSAQVQCWAYTPTYPCINNLSANFLLHKFYSISFVKWIFHWNIHDLKNHDNHVSGTMWMIRIWYVCMGGGWPHFDCKQTRLLQK